MFMYKLILQRAPRLPKEKVKMLIKKFITKQTAFQSAIDLDININTATLYFNHFREKIYEYYYKAPRFSGEVEMDQAFFGEGKKRWAYKRKVNKELERQYGDPA